MSPRLAAGLLVLLHATAPPALAAAPEAPRAALDAGAPVGTGRTLVAPAGGSVQAAVVVEGNVLENVWVDAQTGFAVQVTVRNQDGRAPWSVIEDVAFRGNVVRGAAGGINILVRDDNHPSRHLARLLVAGKAVGFADAAVGDYALGPHSPHRRAGSDGRDLGAAAQTLALARSTPAAATTAAAAGGGSGWLAAVVLWVCAALLGYIYLGYPALVVAWARWRPRPRRRAPIEPPVSILIAACNEADRIDARVRNLLALDYPRERLEILVGSDGSADGTVERAGSWEGVGVRVLAFPTRRGKAAVLNDLAAAAGGEVLVFGDARQRWAPDAVRALVAGFADSRVGAVSGELILTEDDTSVVGNGVGAYWRYEKLIRASESAVDSTVGATGAIYAVRRELFAAIPPDTILDDVLIPLGVVRHGRRVVFEPTARAFDRVAATPLEEFTRKVRTIGGTFQLLVSQRAWLLHPRRNRLFLQTVSHKGLRLLSPVLLLGAFVANATLVDRPFYAGMLAIQVAFYAAAGAGAIAGARGRRPAVLAVPYVFCLLNDATLIALVRFVRGQHMVTWEAAAPGSRR